jgi:hypothetical protein
MNTSNCNWKHIVRAAYDRQIWRAYIYLSINLFHHSGIWFKTIQTKPRWIILNVKNQRHLHKTE